MIGFFYDCYVQFFLRWHSYTVQCLWETEVKFGVTVIFIDTLMFCSIQTGFKYFSRFWVNIFIAEHWSKWDFTQILSKNMTYSYVQLNLAGISFSLKTLKQRTIRSRCTYHFLQSISIDGTYFVCIRCFVWEYYPFVWMYSLNFPAIFWVVFHLMSDFYSMFAHRYHAQVCLRKCVCKKQVYGIHTTMTLLCRILHAVEPINDEMHVTNNWNTWPFILEYFKGNGFPVDDIISAHSQSQCSIVNGNMPKPIIHLLLWKCSYR